ncbi:MAG: hypothetical protein MHPSP_003441, partial [Paramarteilia canceri]
PFDDEELNIDSFTSVYVNKTELSDLSDYCMCHLKSNKKIKGFLPKAYLYKLDQLESH